MAEQFSLFSRGPAEPAAAAKPAPLDPTTLPAPPKLGPPRVRFGASSWTYPGWNGLVYRDVAAYGPSSRFQRLCLAEYARDPRFRTAGADNLYYVAPAERPDMLRRMREQIEGVPENFDLCPKVWHGITVNRYSPQQQAQWRLATEINRDFLDPDLFVEQVLLPLQEALGPHLGPLILEIQENDLHPAAFAQALDRFLSGAQARARFRMAVELRTLAHFTPRYLDTLAAHGVAHAASAWTRMPPIGWQHERVLARHPPGEVLLVRAMLRPAGLAQGPQGPRLVPGSKYAETTEAYQPYDHIVRRLPDVRADILRVIADAPEHGTVYVIINNQLEGHAPGTIAELLAELPGGGGAVDPGGSTD